MTEKKTSHANMLSFEEARVRILSGFQPVTQTMSLPLEESLGRILSQPVVAGLHVPNHDNSAMDGFAVRHQDLPPGSAVRLRVVAQLPAGSTYSGVLGAGEAIRIMTGAPIPSGADCVIMQEECQRDGEGVVVSAKPAKPGQHIRRAGEDILRGAQVLAQGHRLRPADLGLLASLGLNEVQVFRKVRVAVLSTGDEVVRAGQPLGLGQVYDSNGPALRAALRAMGVTVVDLGVVGDEESLIEETLMAISGDVDLILSTGGVSVGDFDLVGEVLKKRGAVEFWKVAMKPGKPQVYGRLGGAIFFGLPGNPVSGLTVFYLMIRPALLRLMGGGEWPMKRLQCRFQGSFSKNHSRMEFPRGVVHFDSDPPWVEGAGAQGSGILTSFSRANALIVLPEGPVQLTTGDKVNVWMLSDD